MGPNSIEKALVDPARASMAFQVEAMGSTRKGWVKVMWAPHVR
jgi:hypothetical protein